MPNDLTVRQETAVQAADQGGGDQVLSIIAAAARDPACDVSKMSALLDFKERIDAKNAADQFTASFAQMASKLPRIKKDGTISLGSGKGSIPFATWEQIDSVIRPILKEHGFTLSFTTRVDGNQLIMAAVLSHVAGHSERSETICKPDPGPGRNETQAGGSGRSYAKRYLTKDMLNLITVGEDDDGKASGFITQEQADKIQTMLEACELSDARKEKFLALFNVSLIAHIQKYQFDEAITALRAELKKQGKA